MVGGVLAGFNCGVVKEYGKFVTGETRQNVCGAKGIAQASGQTDQQFVARLMAEAVIDPLEVVDIDQ